MIHPSVSDNSHIVRYAFEWE